jgi:hypothetical protein
VLPVSAIVSMIKLGWAGGPIVEEEDGIVIFNSFAIIFVNAALFVRGSPRSQI